MNILYLFVLDYIASNDLGQFIINYLRDSSRLLSWIRDCSRLLSWILDCSRLLSWLRDCSRLLPWIWECPWIIPSSWLPYSVTKTKYDWEKLKHLLLTLLRLWVIWNRVGSSFPNYTFSCIFHYTFILCWPVCVQLVMVSQYTCIPSWPAV